jgi:glycosyltransferase involved in cell wall biosynthesis
MNVQVIPAPRETGATKAIASHRRPSRVALVHYWLAGMRGGERVLETLCELYPDADIFTLVADPEKLSPTIRRHRITTSFLQNLGGRRHYQKLLPLMPFALESFDLTDYDLVISSESGPAKGIIPRPDAVHVCYCHSPMRYLWDLYPQYRAGAGAIARAAMSMTAPLLRAWDVSTAARVDHFIANSAYVARRIDKFYRRSADVIHPPVDADRFSIAASPGDYYLCAGQITPYKRIDLAVDAFTQNGKPLVVIGEGASAALRRRAGPNITFLGAVDDATMAHHFAHCRALVFPGIEDFGIVPLEVMASGRPVIALARGGATETVVDGTTGILFEEQTVEALNAAVEEMERHVDEFSPSRIQLHARGFDRSVFRRKLEAYLTQAYDAAASC